MNRDEMLAKLKAIEPTACPTVMTYDMGLEFEFMNSEGAATILGSVGDWPLWKFSRLSLEETFRINEKIKNGTLAVDDFDGPIKAFVEYMLEYHKDANINELLEGITKFSETENEKDFFIYCDIKSWDLETEFFASREEILEDFLNRFQIYASWDDIEDRELEYYCGLLEERGEGIPFNDIDQSDDEDECNN